MILRAARPLDAGSLGAILSAVTDVTPWLPRLHSRAEDIAHAARMIDHGWVTVAEKSGEVLGFIACAGHEVRALYLRPEATGQGIGRRLLSHAKQGQDRLELWTFRANAGARRFYRREGFAEVEHTDGAANDEGLPDVRLIWKRKDAA